MRTKEKRELILDANILIDYCKCDITIISLICANIGQVYLATPVLEEIKVIDENTCIELGIKIVEPRIDHFTLAMEEKGRLSFQDNLCMILAKENGWTCVTNDKPLRRKCDVEGIPLIWGIELICMIVESGGLPFDQAKNIILEIKKNNPKYITDDLVENAFSRIKC